MVGGIDAQHVVRQEPGERPSAQSQGLRREVHVLADEGALDVEARQHAELQVHERELDRAESPRLHPAVETARAAARQLVDDAEPVELVEVDEQQRHVLDRRVRDRHEQRRARLVDVPRVEREEPGLAPREIGSARREGGRRRAEAGDQAVDDLILGPAGEDRDVVRVSSPS